MRPDSEAPTRSPPETRRTPVPASPAPPPQPPQLQPWPPQGMKVGCGSAEGLPPRVWLASRRVPLSLRVPAQLGPHKHQTLCNQTPVNEGGR